MTAVLYHPPFYVTSPNVTNAYVEGKVVTVLFNPGENRPEHKFSLSISPESQIKPPIEKNERNCAHHTLDLGWKSFRVTPTTQEDHRPQSARVVAELAQNSLRLTSNGSDSKCEYILDIRAIQFETKHPEGLATMIILTPLTLIADVIFSPLELYGVLVVGKRGLAS